MAWRREENGDIVIDGWDKGIADTPFDGISDMRNVDIYTYPGCVGLNLKPADITPTSQTVTFTADPTTDIITVSSSLQFAFPNATSAEGRVINLTNSGGALPAGLSAGVDYYIINESSSTQFKVASSFANYLAGTPVDITGAGTGTHTAVTIEMTAAISGCVYNPDYQSNTSFVLDNTGRVWMYKNGLASGNYATGQWVLLTGNTRGSTSIFGRIITFQDWLFVFRGSSTAIDIYGPVSDLTTAGTWYSPWTPAATGVAIALGTSSIPHVPFVGSDGRLYWGDRGGSTNTSLGYVGSLAPNSTTGILFGTNNPSSAVAGTDYTLNKTALDIPSGYYPTAINELGVNLMIGTNKDKIFPWDRVSDSFSIPITTPEYFHDKFVNLNNILYIFSGISGVCYKTNGSQVVNAFKVPRWLAHNGAAYSNNIGFGWGDAVVLNNKIYVSVLSYDSQGIYVYDINNDIIYMDQKLPGSSSFADGAAVILPIYSQFGSLNSIPQGALSYQFIWSSGLLSLSHIYNCLTTNYNFYSDYSSYIVSDAVPVGTFLRKSTLQQIEFKLARPLNTSEGIQLYYSTVVDPNVSFTSIAEYLYDSANPNRLSYEATINVENAEWLLIKAGLKGDDTGSNPNSSLMLLKEIRIR